MAVPVSLSHVTDHSTCLLVMCVIGDDSLGNILELTVEIPSSFSTSLHTVSRLRDNRWVQILGWQRSLEPDSSGMIYDFPNNTL